MTTLRVVVDEENHASEWWDAAHVTEAPAELAPILSGASEVEIPAEAYDKVLTWCAALPGWSDGPEYARTALRFV